MRWFPRACFKTPYSARTPAFSAAHPRTSPRNRPRYSLSVFGALPPEADPPPEGAVSRHGATRGLRSRSGSFGGGGKEGFEINSLSPRDTERAGFEVARRIRPRRGRAALIALDGPLGAGKTTFVRGVFRGLGVRRRAGSPTFILLRRFPLPSRYVTFSLLYHIDLYRVRGRAAARALGLKDIIRDSRAVVIVEWAAHLPRHFLTGAVRIAFSYGNTPRTRVIAMKRTVS